MAWYSERMTPIGRWAPQVTPNKPCDRTTDGKHVTLRRVRELRPHEVHLTVGALHAIENERALLAWERAQEEVPAARDMVATGIAE
ncbi:hypothetical protein [Roseinatronobacter alkalisoli]|uniref:Uncharacterized protein n=1 Tax=Roseinatronobacter alkalisoli TaxID=3028235 RepID=A0ABT5TCR3_9RHOB|nr:hypothetical protein [Roseinatronobacter sp. HJB301]MDD7972485.1 hypothetical protein [Roseinatronobacter sp. HJB301]